MSGHISFSSRSTSRAHDFVMDSPGAALQIISIEDGKFKLNESNLNCILNHKKNTNKPIIIISIVGSFRTGKSFFLTNFLRYLYGKNEDFQLDNEVNTGFNWSYGSNSHTKGIWMWNTPINIKLKSQNNKEISILLMDTQGIFDNETSQTECAAIFSLSAFMSSIQIFNIKNNIEKRDLEYLSIFAQYKSVAEKILKKSFQFEQLTFLIRDWQFPDEHKYGFEGGEALLDKRLETCKPNVSKDLTHMLSNLKKYFKQRNCFLLPHPGTQITKKEFNGSLKSLDSDFINYCNMFFQSTLESIRLDVNEHRDCIFKNGENLFNMFKEYVHAFENNSFPNLESITIVYSKHNNLMCKQAEIASYNRTLTQFLNQNKKFVKMNHLEALHEETLKLCLQNYMDYSMESQELLNEYHDLENIILNAFISYKEISVKQNSLFINNLKETACSEYNIEMKNYFNQINNYVKPIELFLKHQKAKVNALKEFSKLESESDELNREYNELSDTLDKLLENFDRENYLKKTFLINEIKSKCILTYKSLMDEKCSDMIKTGLEENQFHDWHILATTKCIEEFEKMTQLHPDLNTDYESLVVNDLRGLYSSYYLINKNKKKPTFSLKEKLSSYLNPDKMNQIRFSDSHNGSMTSSSKTIVSSLMDLINLGLFIASFIIHMFVNTTLFFIDLIFNFNSRSTNIFNFFIISIKSTLTNLSTVLFDPTAPSFDGLVKSYRYKF